MDFSLVASQNRGNYFLLQKALGSVAFTVKEEKKNYNNVSLIYGRVRWHVDTGYLEQKGVCLC